MKYFPTIGLEIHAELKTQTKMFCGCPNDPDEKHPNVNVCPVCLGHPGVLPTINKKALEFMVKTGLAVEGAINERFKFDRKNYFYPDLPKGYQISQYDLPVVKGGELDISARLGSKKNVALNRVHLEEDAGKLMHDEAGHTLVDFNRGGVPLMELVTEPDMHGVEEAVAFSKEFQLLLRYLDVSDADLERGQMRFDANISLTNDKRQTTNDKLGIKVEIKNLNSFAALDSAIRYEIERQSGLLEDGKPVSQETRGWDDVKQITVSQRSKEEAHDYRYFPEPDLPPIDISIFRNFDMSRLRLDIPELPNAKRQRFQKDFGLSADEANNLVESRAESEFFEESVSELEADAGGSSKQEKIKLLFNYFTSDLRGLLKDRGLVLGGTKLSPDNFSDLIVLLAQGKISSRVAKDILPKLVETGVDPGTLIESEGLGQLFDEESLSATVEKVLSGNPGAVADYKNGKQNALQFLIGKAMAELKGRGNPAVLKKMFEQRLR